MSKDELGGRAVTEPCTSCGEETAAGSPFFSDRRVVERPGGDRAYVCSLCDQRLAEARRGTRLTDEEVRRLVDTGSLGMIAGLPGVH